MAIGRYKSENAVNPRGGYQEPFVVTTLIIDHKDGHYVKPNKVAFKYLDFKKDVDLDVDVKVSNSVVKLNVETSKIYINNAFSYTLRNMALN